MMSRMRCSRRWKKWSAPGTTTTGSSCGRAQSSAFASGAVSSSSPWITMVSGGTALGAVGPPAGDEAVRHADEHEPLRLDPLRDARLHVGAEREAGERDRQRAEPAQGPVHHAHEIVGLAVAVVVLARARADAAEVRPHRDVAELGERARERLRDLVVERAAEERMRMGDQRDSARRLFRCAFGREHRRMVDGDLDPARRPVDREPFGLPRHRRSRSTMRPWTRCSWTISSMSDLST